MSRVIDRQRMIDAAASLLNDGELVLVGVGAPSIAAHLARERHAPGLRMVYESGAIEAAPAAPALSIGDPTLFAGALASYSLDRVFSSLIAGRRIDTAFVGAAQIDRRARMNSTCIGPYQRPSVRLPGSGGACEIVASAGRVIVMVPLERRRFPETVDFVTSTPRPETEVVVVTEDAILRRRAHGDELELAEVFPGVEASAVAEVVGWDLALGGSAANSAGAVDG